jgi:hypothetical protein
MPRERTSDDSCNAIARLIKDFCSCSENGAWSPEMTSEKRKDPHLKSELTNMSAMRRRIMTIAKRRSRTITPEPPKLYDKTHEKKTETLTSNLINTTISSQSSTLRRNIDNFLLSRRMFALEEDIYEKPIQLSIKNSSCGENWSLSKAWKNNNSDFFNRSPVFGSDRLINRTQLERIDEVPRRKKREKLKEQIRYDKNIKRHIRIRVMLSLRMRRYMKRRLRKPLHISQNVNVPPRRFHRGSSNYSSFGTRSYRSVMTDKLGDGAVLFDVHEARNTTLELCHDYEEDLDTLEIALRAGNFR